MPLWTDGPTTIPVAAVTRDVPRVGSAQPPHWRMQISKFDCHGKPAVEAGPMAFASRSPDLGSTL